MRVRLRRAAMGLTIAVALGLVTVLAIAALVLASSFRSRAPDTAALGPVVDRIPDGATTALLLSQVEVLGSGSGRWEGDSAWLVFLDDAGRPLGHVGATAMMQNRLARAGEAIALAQPESFRIISRTGPPTTLPHPNDYAVAAASSTSSPTREAFLWTGYGPAAGLRLRTDGDAERLTRRGPVVAAGHCGDDYYLAAGTTAAITAPSRITLERASLGGPFEPVASWVGRPPLDRGVPITCTGSTVRVPLNDANPGPAAASDSASNGVIGFREVDAATGQSRWIPATTPVISQAIFDRLSAAHGSAIAWRADTVSPAITTYVDSTGALARLVPGTTEPEVAGQLGDGDGVRPTAATVGDGTHAVLALRHRSNSGNDAPDSTTLITYDLTTGAELARLTPDFLKGKALGPAGVTVSDIVLLR